MQNHSFITQATIKHTASDRESQRHSNLKLELCLQSICPSLWGRIGPNISLKDCIYIFPLSALISFLGYSCNRNWLSFVVQGLSYNVSWGTAVCYSSLLLLRPLLSISTTVHWLERHCFIQSYWWARAPDICYFGGHQAPFFGGNHSSPALWHSISTCNWSFWTEWKPVSIAPKDNNVLKDGVGYNQSPRGLARTNT